MMNAYKTDKNPLWLYCLFLFLTTFCELNLSIGGNAFKYAHYFLLMAFFLLGYKRAPYVQSFWCILLLSIFGNCLSSYVFRNQSFEISYFAYDQIWYLFFFFALVLTRYPLHVVEKFLMWAILTVTIVYYIQLVIFPKVVWGNAGAQWVAENDLYFRGLVVGGESAVSLGYLFFLNKFLVAKKRYFLIGAIICAIPFFIRGYRIMIMGSLLSTLWLYARGQENFKLLKFLFKIILISFLLVALVLILYQHVPIVQASLDSLLDRSGESNQTFDNDDYIRIISINYYYTSFFKSPIELFFGAGMIGDTGPVADVFAKLMMYNYNLTDWGLIGLSWYAGIPVVLCIIYYLIRGILLKVPKEYSYINAWFLYLLIISLTDPEMYQHYSFMVQSILLYMLYLINPRFLKFK